MAANEFEKSVRKVMDEFKLHPSDEVWQNVEERIREKNKKRRVLFFLFCFLGLVIAGSGLYIFSNNQGGKSNNKSQNSKQQQIPVSASNSPNKNDSAKMSVPQQTAIGQRSVHAKTNNHKNSTPKSKISTGTNKTNVTYVLKTENLKATNSLGANKKQGERNVIANTTQQKPRNVSIDKAKILNDTESQKVVASETQKNVESNISSDTTQIKNKENKPSESAVQTNMPKKHDQKSMKLKWGLNFSAGSSRLTENLFSLNNSSSSGSYLAAAPGNINPGSASIYSVDDKAGFAFKAGAMVKKNFSLRSALSTGLNYVYFSDKIKIGVQQSATLQLPAAYNVSSYYAGSPQKDFTEHFHFIELPILYTWRITQNKNHFLSLDAGISIAYLLSTNALVYDTAASGIFYHNNDLITKTYFNIIPGISYHFINSKGLEFAIGPQFSFDMTRAIKSDFDKRNYFSYAGISATLFFEKKKK